MSNHRLAQVNEQLKREISRILRREVHDPRIGIVVVTGVDASGDLSVARVHVRPSGEEKDWQAMMEGLDAAAAFVRRELGKDLRLRKIPELRFQADRTLEQAMRIERILDDVIPEGGDGGEDGRGGPDDGASSDRGASDVRGGGEG